MSESQIFISSNLRCEKNTFEKEILDNSNISEKSTETENEEEKIENLNKPKYCKLSEKINETIEKMIENNKKNKRRKIIKDSFT